ncbi:endonuclease [Polaribacter sp.]|uniref:endonuclease n=1 Tax=Polaribacter sp. TaxID=1920175 RepID=UPI003EF599AC
MKKTLLFISLFSSFLINAQAEPYYSDVDLTAEGVALKDNLSTKTIAAHTNILSYGWDALQATDVNPENSSEVLLIYGYSASGTTARTSGVNNICSSSCPDGSWNREHTYAKSLGTPNLGTSGPGADAHHLRPSDVSFNSQRGSLRFADGSGNAGSVSGGWYPGDEWKGDVARMMMYMYIRYGSRCLPSNVGIGSTASTPDEMIDLFLEWNVEDPVSDFERQRNTYHTSGQSYSQGNRNPFIDNAYLATRIWGGDPAVDSWGIYTSSDTEAPTVPTNLALSNITTATIDASWTASIDNEAVTKYEIYANGTLHGESTTTTYTLTGLNSNTAYAVTVLAKDIANNKSAQSTAANATTLADTTAPSIPTNITITSETGTSFKVNWTASTDDTGVASYDVYVDGNLNGNTTETNYQVTSLSASTTYSVTVLAKDSANNMSSQSTAVNATTTDGSNNIVELFFSEYVEGSSYNKAIEIANLTDNSIDLSTYSVQRQSRGAWETALNLSGTIENGDVYVITNSSTTDQHLIDESDLGIPNVTPMTFNGDDRVGLFKNGVLIDIIGDLDGTTEFAKDVTLRRKLSVSSPNTTYTTSEWDVLDKDTVDGIGVYDSNTASVHDNALNNIKLYPNPTTGNTLYISTSENTNVSIYNLLGKVVKTATITKTKNNLDISNLAKGIYIVKMNIKNATTSKKLIKN